MFVRASLVRAGLVLVLLLLVPARVVADAPLRFMAGATTAQTDDPASTPGLVLGGAFTLRRWSPLSYVTIAPQL